MAKHAMAKTITHLPTVLYTEHVKIIIVQDSWWNPNNL